MAISAVKCALDTAAFVMPETDGDERIHALELKKDQLDTLRGKLFPFEAAAIAEINARLDVVNRDLDAARAASRWDVRLPRLDASVLSWTTKQSAWRMWFGKMLKTQMPALAYVPVDASRLQLRVSWGSPDGVVHPRVPGFVAAQYHEALKPIAGWTGSEFKHSSATLEYRFHGIVPDDIRQLIEAEQSKGRFEQLAFICEVHRWEIEAAPSVRYGDPILVGVKDEAMWVLGSFDPTPTEEYLLREFTQ